MSEYVVNPWAAHAIVRAAEDSAEKAATATTELVGESESLTVAFGTSRVADKMDGWLAAAGVTLGAALTRADNAVGGTHLVIDTLELADVRLAGNANAVVDDLTNEALGEINLGMSR